MVKGNSYKRVIAIVLATSVVGLYMLGGRNYFATKQMHRTEEEVNTLLKKRDNIVAAGREIKD